MGTPVVSGLTGVLFLFSIIVFLTPTVCVAATADQAVHLFDNLYISGLYSISTDEMSYLLGISQGTELTPALVRSGIKRAFLKEIFDDIVFKRATDGRIDILVRERKIIHRIEIEGADLLSERTVRRLLGISPGDRVMPLIIDKRLAKLKESLKDRGFPRAEIGYRVVPMQDNRAVLRILIREGLPEIIERITLMSGSAELPLRLPLAEGDVLDKAELEKFTSKLLSRQKKERRVKSRFEYSFTEGNLDILFDAGRKVLVEFIGNTALSEARLMREITFYEIDDFSDELIEEAVSRITSRYHREGFAFVRIVPTISASDDVVTVSFFIQEGNNYTVESVNFSGSTLDPLRLREIVLLKKGGNYDPDETENDRASLVDFYQSLGFMKVTVEPPEVHFDGSRASISYEINEGQQVLIDGIIIKNNVSISRDELLSKLKVKTGNPYNVIDVLDSSRTIRDLYNRNGYLDATVSVSREIDDAKATVVFDISEGSRTSFGRRIIVGNQQTRDRVISREFLHVEGEPFSYAKIYEERIRLYKTGLFDDIEITPVETGHEEKDVVYRFSEAPAGEFEFGFGYGNFEKLRGFFNVRHNNLWGLNKRISVRTEFSELNNRLLIAYDEPWFISREIPLKVLLLAENKKELNYDTKAVLYKLNRYLGSVGTEANFSPRVKMELYYSGSITETYDVQPDVVLSRQDVGTLFISAVRSGLIYDSRNNTFTPTKGILAGVSLEVASFVLFSETDYAKLSMNVNVYQGITEWLVGALSLRGGIAKGYRETDDLPIVKRFFLGGRTTVRGYKEDTLGPKGTDGNPTGGDAFLMGNFEFRSNIWKGFGAVVFLDAGNVWQKISEVDIKQIRFTTGLGLRYNTPVGPLSIDYGIKLSRLEGESKGTLYFTIGNAF